MSNLELLEKFPKNFKGKIVTLSPIAFGYFVETEKIKVLTRDHMVFRDDDITNDEPRGAYYIFTGESVVLKLLN